MTYTYAHSDGRAIATLTTEHPASSHGLPVLVIAGQAYGPADLVPGLPNEDIFGATAAAEIVKSHTSDNLPNEVKAAADRYLSQWPDGPQLVGVIIRH